MRLRIPAAVFSTGITDYLANTSGGFTDNSANLFTTVDPSWNVQDNGIH